MADPRLAVIAERLASRNAADARRLAEALLADPTATVADRVSALALRARAHELEGNLAAAVSDLEAAVALNGKLAGLWNELGILQVDAGRPEHALGAFEQATRADPNHARAWNNLGNALRQAGRIGEALVACERAVRADPVYALAWANLGGLARDAGDDASAEAALRRALELQPAHRGALLTLGRLLRDRSELLPAAQLFRRACEADPRDAQSAFQLAETCAERGDVAAAREAYAIALARDPQMLRALFGHELALPMLAADGQAVTAARTRYAEGMATLEREAPARGAALSTDRLLDELRWTNFLLAYQGEDDRGLQARFARVAGDLVAKGAPQWRQPLAANPRSGARIRIGFASAFFRDGTVGRYFEHWITDLPREEFEVVVYHLFPLIDPLARRLRARADRFEHCARERPSQLAPRIRADALDVLVYPELGMGAETFALAALRLAPLQIAGWGHPVTTGHDTIDVFLSVAAMEPENPARHYTERLVTLPGIGTRYASPEVPAAATRASCGLPTSGPLLLCPQSLFKIHPDNDALFARILAAIAGATLVVFEGRDPQLTARYHARLAVAGVDLNRVATRPQCSHEDFLRINSVCDVMLDTLYWSGGNTSLDALACGLPIVTQSGTFMRGRQSAGMLRLIGCDELIVDDEDAYIRAVERLAREVAYRDVVVSRIRAGRGRLFDDPAPIDALAAFVREACA